MITAVVVNSYILIFQVDRFIHIRSIEKVTPAITIGSIIVVAKCTVAEDCTVYLVIRNSVIFVERLKIKCTISTCLPSTTFETASFHFQIHNVLGISGLMAPETSAKTYEIAIYKADILYCVCLAGIHKVVIVCFMTEFNIIKLQTGEVRTLCNTPTTFQNNNRFNSITTTGQTEAFHQSERSDAVRRTCRQIVFCTFGHFRIDIVVQQHRR